MKPILVAILLVLCSQGHAYAQPSHIDAIKYELEKTGLNVVEIVALPDLRNNIATQADNMGPAIFGGPVKAFHYKILASIEGAAPLSCSRVTLTVSFEKPQQVEDVDVSDCIF